MILDFDEDKAWIAGFFDGEGCVQLEHTTNGRKDGGRTFKLSVHIGQKRRDVLDQLKFKFGGHISRHKGGCHQWVVTSKQADTFLYYIWPYVKLKDEVVRLALESRRYISRRRTERNTEACLSIRKKIMELNHKD